MVERDAAGDGDDSRAPFPDRAAWDDVLERIAQLSDLASRWSTARDALSVDFRLAVEAIGTANPPLLPHEPPVPLAAPLVESSAPLVESSAASGPSLRGPGPSTRPRVRPAAVLTAIAALVAIGLISWQLPPTGTSSSAGNVAGVATTRQAAPPPRTSDQVAAAGRLAGWLRTDVDPTARVALPSAIAALLLADPGGAPPQSLKTAAPAGPDEDLVVLDTGSGETSPGGSGTPIARFGDLEVRQAGADATAGEDEEQRSLRAASGRDLAANPALTMSRTSDQHVVAGDADPRLMTFLAQVAATHGAMVQLQCEGADAAPGSSSCRTAELLVIDGAAISSRDALPLDLRQLLAQLSSSRSASSTVLIAGSSARSTFLRVTFFAPLPATLLGGASFAVVP